MVMSTTYILEDAVAINNGFAMILGRRRGGLRSFRPKFRSPEQKVVSPGLEVDSPGIFYEDISHNM